MLLRFVQRPLTGAGIAAMLFVAPNVVAAQERMMPVPSVIIYPNTVIQPNMLVDRSIPSVAAGNPNYYVADRDALLGKVTRRTLLPNVPIPATSVTEPHLVANGTQVRIVFSEGGVTITTFGSAMQAGAIGDLVRVRNSDSGIIVSGVVEADGTVRVGDS